MMPSVGFFKTEYQKNIPWIPSELIRNLPEVLNLSRLFLVNPTKRVHLQLVVGSPHSLIHSLFVASKFQLDQTKVTQCMRCEADRTLRIQANYCMQLQ